MAPSRIRLGLVATALAVVVLGRAAPAHAQASDPEARPTRGPYITGGVRTGDADATAVELNPGALPLMPHGELELVASAAHYADAIPRRGGGLYWGAPIGGSALGLSLTGVAGDAGNFVDGRTIFRLAYGLRLGRSAGLGVAWAHIWGGHFGGVDTFDVGLSARAGRYLALGLVVEDVGAPHPAAAPAELPRLWVAELAVRPLGTTRLELAVGAAHANGDEWNRIVPRARASLVVTDGLRLYAEGERVPRADHLALEGGSDTRLGFGLALDLDHLGAMIGTQIFAPGAGDNAAGFAARLRVTGERQTSLLAPAHVVRVSLDGVDDERKFLTVTRQLRALAVDRGVAAVMLKIENVRLGLGRIEELRDLCAFLRAHGKATFAYAPSPSTREYYLATAADRVVLNPAGDLSLTGMSQSVTFYKTAMDRIGVRVDLVRIAEYKGAAEPFILNEASEPVRANKNKLLDDLFGHLVDGIAADRTRSGHPMDAAAVRAFVERGVFLPGEAQRAGLVDGATDESELEALFGRALGAARVAIRDPDGAPLARGAWPSRRIAVVMVDGNIVDGPSQDLPFDLGSFAGSDTLVAALDQCRRDGSIGAVVLRVNSPGGSAFASDVIAHAINQLRAAGKPVIVSMGDVAASGGYYIAAPADAIYAEPSTISGSIGVFGFKADVGGLMKMLGLNVETTKRGAHADYMSSYRGWTDEEIKIATSRIRHIYDMFLETVATGRKSRGLTAARVDGVGRGQVWSGGTAQSLGLVDRMGGLAVAIDEASRLARAPLGRDGLPEIEVLPKSPSSALRKLVGLAADADDAPASELATAARLLTPELRGAIRLAAPLLLGAGTGIQAQLPYDIDIR
jgi:protease-4